VPALRVEPVGAATLQTWRYVHNTIIPADPLSLDDVRERAGRNRLDLAYAGDVLVGNATVRPPAGEWATATVIVRVLPGHRRRGYGQELLRHELERARALGAETIETVVLAANEDGLRFARARGFVEVARYLPDGEFVTLRIQ
jgi:GNAT superfamily N-acetyltransferase